MPGQKSVRGITRSRGAKHALDKFYTKSHVAQACLDMLPTPVADYDVIIEPSAGAGSFSSLLNGVVAYDLAPEADGVTQADWFEVDKHQYMQQKVLVVGNPPFGTAGNLALEFIREAARFADTIAFILPKGFMKRSYKNRVPLNFELVVEWERPSNTFTLEGADYDVPSVFQVWERTDTLREKDVYKGNPRC